MDNKKPPQVQKHTRRQYAKRKTQHEILPDNLREEIAMLRILMRRVMALADEGHALSDVLRLLDCVGKASTRLGTLLKTERLLDERQDMAGALNEALAEMINDLSSNNPNPS